MLAVGFDDLFSKCGDKLPPMARGFPDHGRAFLFSPKPPNLILTWPDFAGHRNSLLSFVGSLVGFILLACWLTRDDGVSTLTLLADYFSFPIFVSYCFTGFRFRVSQIWSSKAIAVVGAPSFSSHSQVLLSTLSSPTIDSPLLRSISHDSPAFTGPHPPNTLVSTIYPCLIPPSSTVDGVHSFHFTRMTKAGLPFPTRQAQTSFPRQTSGLRSSLQARRDHAFTQFLASAAAPHVTGPSTQH